MKQAGLLLSAMVWLLVAGSVVVLTGGLFGRPLLLAAVPTGSMLPVLVPGDMIVVLPTWLMPEPVRGDIVVFKTPQDKQWVVHRIIDGSGSEGYVTKGDANGSADLPRVFPGDVAGVVPQWQDGALRLPRLGLLSLSDGPFTSPVVAGIALVMGIYLLVLDVKPRVKLPKFRLRSQGMARPSAVLSLYLGLAATVFLTTLIPAWTLSSSQLIHYEVVPQRSLTHSKDTQYALGETHREQVPVQNPSPLPIVVVFGVGDENVTYDPWWALVAPRRKRTFSVTVQTPQLGEFNSKVNTGVFLPLLPPVVLAFIARQNMALAAVVTALVPAVLMLGVALLDLRSRSALTRFRSRIAARFGI